MFSFVVVSLVVTVMFTLTAVHALVRLATPGAVRPGVADRAAVFSHLLMSVAMIAMVWGWAGGPASPSGIVEVTVFGVIAVWFVARALLVAAGDVLVSYLLHAVMAAAMAWMVVVPSAGMAGMRGMEPGASGSGTVVTAAFVVLLAAVAVRWGARAFRTETDGAPGSGRVGVRVTGLARPRLDACSHLLMSLGTGWMLLAMS